MSDIGNRIHEVTAKRQALMSRKEQNNAKVVSFLSPGLFERSKAEIRRVELGFLKNMKKKKLLGARIRFLIVPASNPPITAQVIQNIPSVRLLQVFGAGFDKIDIAAAKEPTPGGQYSGQMPPL